MKDKDLIRLQHMLDYSLEALSTASGRKRSDLDLDILWDTVDNNLPELIKELEKIPELNL